MQKKGTRRKRTKKEAGGRDIANPLHTISAWSLFPPSCLSPPITPQPFPTYAHLHTDTHTYTHNTHTQSPVPRRDPEGTVLYWLSFVALWDWICIQDSFFFPPRKKYTRCRWTSALWFENVGMQSYHLVYFVSKLGRLETSGSLMVVSSFQLFHHTITYRIPILFSTPP